MSEKYLTIKIPLALLPAHIYEQSADSAVAVKRKYTKRTTKHVPAGKLTTNFTKLSKGDEFVFPSSKYGNHVFKIKRILRTRGGDPKTQRVETEYEGKTISFATFVLKGRAKKVVKTK